MNRKTVYTIAILVLMFFLFFNPFGKRNEGDVPRPYARDTTIQGITEYLTNHHQAPEAYLANKFRDYEIVLVGEFGRVKEQVEVINRTLPLIYDRGIRTLGVEVALFEDTPKIDAILTADSFDEDAVEAILFNRMVLWGFEEYVDLFRTAWELNANREEGEKPFRIVGLNVPISWEYLVDERDMRNPEIVAQVYENGIPDVFIADVILNEFVRKNEKALVYTSMQHAFTRFSVTEYVKQAETLKLGETRRAGNIVYDTIGSKATTVLFHSPWPESRGQTLVTYPAEGAIDLMMKELPEELRTAGFDTNGTPFGELESEGNDFAKGHDDLTLGQVCDGYIITGHLSGLTPVTQIPDFVNDGNIDRALIEFPGPNVDPMPAEDLNAYIGSILESTQSVFDRFKIQ